MGRKYTDNALTTLASSITAGSTTLTVATGKGNNFPAVTGHGTPGATPDFFVITMEDAARNIEKIRVENRAVASDVLGSAGFPLVRGYDGTIARAWNAGDSVDLRMDKSAAQEHEDKAQAARTLFGVKGSTTTGLTLGFYGGYLIVDGVLTAIGDGTVALTASQTNFVERTAAGVVSANTSGFSADKIPLHVVVADGTGITSISDRRAENFPDLGALSKSVAGSSNVTLTADEARPLILILTGVLTGNIDVVFPNIKRSWFVSNTTTGAFAITCKVSGQPGTLLSQGSTSVLYGNGTDILAAGRPADVQTFTADGTWTKPAGAKVVEVILIGPGGGGGGGRGDAAGTLRLGGTGGGGGATARGTFNSVDLGASVAVTVPAGGTGGPGGSSGNGTSGTAGGTTTFGTHLSAFGGGGGFGGTNNGGANASGAGGGGTGGVGGNGATAAVAGGFPIGGSGAGSGGSGAGTTQGVDGFSSEYGGAAGGGTNGAGGGATGKAGGSAIYASGGGGAGGSVQAGNSELAGGAGGAGGAYGAGGGGTAGAVNGVAGGDGANGTAIKMGAGGGGGGGQDSGTGGAGGIGGNPGGGGGGGAGGTTIGGAGSAGGRGEVRVYTFF